MEKLFLLSAILEKHHADYIAMACLALFIAIGGVWLALKRI